MLDWTGERFLPWIKEATVAYEHLHRYFWVGHLVKGKRVLDLASGEGYGSALLAEQAGFVCGVEIDPQAVEHAAEKYRRPNLKFLQGNILQVPLGEDRSFDVAVCFEAIEHVEEHDQLLQEVLRLLKPEGVFVVSTPNKDVYRAASEEANPFHVKELRFGEFDALLSRHFSSVRYMGQRVHPSSTIWPIGGSSGIEEVAVARTGEEFRRLGAEDRTAQYFVAVASNAKVDAVAGSVLVDHSDQLLQEKDRERDVLRKDLSQREEALEWRAHQVGELEREKRELVVGLESARKDAARVARRARGNTRDTMVEVDREVARPEGAAYSLGF
jgi:ubiquinone/menaquinone biosynthesis C-methylase UbiE